MRNAASKYSLLVGLIVLIAAYGCTLKSGQFQPNSHVPYPNSNIVNIGHVTGTATKWTWFSGSVDKEMIDTAYSNALKQKGGDLLLNFKITTETTTFLIIPIIKTEPKVEGTAAKMTIGRQELR